MRRLAALGLAALLYGVTAWAVNPAFADGLTPEEVAELKGLRSADMTKLIFHPEAEPRMEATFKDVDGNEVSLADFEGKIVVLNFWATWCPPCRAEMPSIARLERAMAGQDLAVIALSTDRFDTARVAEFLDKIGATTLSVWHDRRGLLAREAAVLGMPVTVLLDRQGREIARLQGEAEWDGAPAKAILTRLIELTAPRT